MPKSPHSSWNRSSIDSPSAGAPGHPARGLSGHVALKPVSPRMGDLGEREVDEGLATDAKPEALATDRPDPHPGNGRLRHQYLEPALVLGRNRQDDPRRPLTEQRHVGPGRHRETHLSPDRRGPGDARLGEPDGDAALSTIMRARNESCLDRGETSGLDTAL